jgi:hypothetical protein
MVAVTDERDADDVGAAAIFTSFQTYSARDHDSFCTDTRE